MQILVIGRNREINETVVRLINAQPGWFATGCLSDEDAIDTFANHNFHLVLIGGGVDPASERDLRTRFITKNPSVKIIQHFGGGSGLLFSEIQEAIKN